MRSLPEDIAVLHRQRMKEAEANDRATPRSRQEEVRDVMQFLRIQIESRDESSRSRCPRKPSATGHQVRDPHFQPPLPSALELAAGSATNSHACCVLCRHREHTVNYCNSNMTIDEIRMQLIENNCCFKCARKGHVARQCRSAEWLKCKLCAKHHLTILCKIWKPANCTDADSSDKTKTDGLPAITSATTSSSAPLPRDVLMQAATVSALGRHDSALFRILIDTGCERTFIRRDLSTRLGLPSVGIEDLSLLMFGNSKRSHTYRNRTMQPKLQSRLYALGITVDAV
nr:uncharacterized protein LOC119172625 [Rhipicephalus microplus]